MGRKLITRSIDICFGRHVIAGTGLSVSVLAGRHEAGDSISLLMREFGLSRARIQAAIYWAKQRSKAANKGWRTRRGNK